MCTSVQQTEEKLQFWFDSRWIALEIFDHARQQLDLIKPWIFFLNCPKENSNNQTKSLRKITRSLPKEQARETIGFCNRIRVKMFLPFIHLKFQQNNVIRYNHNTTALTVFISFKFLILFNLQGAIVYTNAVGPSLLALLCNTGNCIIRWKGPLRLDCMWPGQA